MSDCVGRVSCIPSCFSVCVSNMDPTVVPIMKVPNDIRFIKLKDIFIGHFHTAPSFYVRVPGRVNLIGEHIDYCGYTVLPMALKQDILIAVATTPDKYIHVKNVNEQYPDLRIEVPKFEDMEIQPDVNGKPFWYNYVLCGIKGALQCLEDTDIGLRILVDGNIPPAAGLSSSSALVSASCVAFLHAHKAVYSKTHIASLCAASERYIGTQGGGMDQAIAFFAEKNCAQLISFFPLQASSVALPENAVFVVAHSLAEANKAANNAFNTRVVECKIAAHVLASVENINMGFKPTTLRTLHKHPNHNFLCMIEMVQRVLTKDNYTLEEVCNILNIDNKVFGKLFLTENTKNLTNFKLKQRALHVYEEAYRVEKFQIICKEAVGNANVIRDLGTLMSESHESLKNLYECSHDNLDKLVDLSYKFGVKARLTGAGWGGCIVAICSKEILPKYMEYISEEFYVKLFNIDKTSIPKYLFATAPHEGAVIYQNSC